MSKKTNLDPSSLHAEDPEFVQFVPIFCRYFYGRRWFTLSDSPNRMVLEFSSFPLVLGPKDAWIDPPRDLAATFRYCLKKGENPDPDYLMTRLKLGPRFRGFLGPSLFGSPLVKEQEVGEALERHLHRSFCTALQDYRIRNPENPTPDTKSIAQFPSAEGLRFAEISWAFTLNDTVRIRARGITKSFTFSEIGFKDGRTADRPIMLWGLLKEGFAAHNGEIDFDSTLNLPSKVTDQMKANVKRLKKILQAIFGLEENPFEPYERREEDAAHEGRWIKSRSYKLKMSIRDETNG